MRLYTTRGEARKNFVAFRVRKQVDKDKEVLVEFTIILEEKRGLLRPHREGGRTHTHKPSPPSE